MLQALTDYLNGFSINPRFVRFHAGYPRASLAREQSSLLALLGFTLAYSAFGVLASL